MSTEKKTQQATDVLEHEHDVILLVLQAAQREADRTEKTGKLNPDKVRKIIDFVRNFADKCHHAKEERLLFERMRQKGFPIDSGPLAVMIMEHDQGRRYIASIVDALPEAARGKASAVTLVVENLRSYVNLLRDHIAKENQVLYPMANRLFSPQEQQELIEGFEKVESQEMGEGTHEKYHQLAHELEHD